MSRRKIPRNEGRKKGVTGVSEKSGKVHKSGLIKAVADTKKEIEILGQQMIIKGLAGDNEIENSTDVAAVVATSSISRHVVLKAPKVIYKTSKAGFKGVGLTVEIVKKMKRRLKKTEVNSLTAYIEAMNIWNAEDTDFKYSRKKGLSKKQRRQQILYEADKFGIEVVKEETKNEKLKRFLDGGISINEYDGGTYIDKVSTSHSRLNGKNNDLIGISIDKGKKNKESKEKSSHKRKENLKRYMKQVFIESLTKSDTTEGKAVKKITAKNASMFSKLSAAVVKKLALTIINMLYPVIACMLPLLAAPVMVVLIVVILAQIPPISWATTSTSSESIIITYEDKMREFGIEIDAYEADDNSIITYNIDEEELRKNATIIFLSKKGLDYNFFEMSEEDKKLFGEILDSMVNHTMNINSYVEIEDGSLIGKKYIDMAVKAGDYYGSDVSGIYIEGSCNEHGVTGEKTTSGEIIHTTKEWYFIPCEVSQYSMLPIGLCIQITEPNSRENYVLQIVDKMEDTKEDNEYLYICGDMRTIDDDGNFKDVNIYTKAYNAVRYFSNSNLVYPDSDILYTGLLDKARAEEYPSYNILYRSASSLAEEFDMTIEEQEEVFGKLNTVTEEELKDAKIYIPKKEINIWSEDLKLYAAENLTAEEYDRFNDIMDLVNDNNEDFLKYVDVLYGGKKDIVPMIEAGAGTECESMAKYIYEVYIESGQYVPPNASQLAKFIENNGTVISNADELQNGDLIFISRDYGTYKDITDVAVKVEGGYLNYIEGKIIYEKALRVHTATTYGSVVMYGRIK